MATIGVVGYEVLDRSKPHLSLLAWSGYEERDFLEPFEKVHGARVKVRTYANADEMVSILLGAPKDFDLVVVDPEYISTLAAKGLLSELDYKQLDLSGYFSFFRDHPLTRANGNHYAVPIRFGINSLVFNAASFAANSVTSYQALFSESSRGHVGIWDWYLPNMGVLSRALGHPNPYDLSEVQFANLKMELAQLRPAVRSIHASLPELVGALASNQIAIAPGVGEFVAAAATAKGGAPISWTLPPEGGVMWVETMTICSQSRNQALAHKFLQWVTTPAAQASLASRRAYESNSPNQLAYPLLSAAQRSQLNAETPAQTEALIARLSVRTLPTRQSAQEWQQAWRAFKAA